MKLKSFLNHFIILSLLSLHLPSCIHKQQVKQEPKLKPEKLEQLVQMYLKEGKEKNPLTFFQKKGLSPSHAVQATERVAFSLYYVRGKNKQSRRLWRHLKNQISSRKDGSHVLKEIEYQNSIIRTRKLIDFPPGSLKQRSSRATILYQDSLKILNYFKSDGDFNRKWLKSKSIHFRCAKSQISRSANLITRYSTHLLLAWSRISKYERYQKENKMIQAYALHLLKLYHSNFPREYRCRAILHIYVRNILSQLEQIEKESPHEKEIAGLSQKTAQKLNKAKMLFEDSQKNKHLFKVDKGFKLNRSLILEEEQNIYEAIIGFKKGQIITFLENEGKIMSNTIFQKSSQKYKQNLLSVYNRCIKYINKASPDIFLSIRKKKLLFRRQLLLTTMNKKNESKKAYKELQANPKALSKYREYLSAISLQRKETKQTSGEPR